MIVSATVSNNRENEIAGAIHSVIEHVDRVLLVDTGITDRTVERAREVAGEKLVTIKHTWVDFSDARNASLRAARELGATWIVILDSDERINFGNVDLEEELEKTEVDAICIESADGHYPKEKIVRASADATYVGPTHEALLVRSKETLRGATFFELPKSEAQLRQKFTRDIEILTAHIEKDPNDPRWRFYLGLSREGIGDNERASVMFGECAAQRKIGEEAAWASYKQAEQLIILGRFDEAIDAAARGLAADSSFAECAWIASVAASRAGRNNHAVFWARMSEATGLYKGCGSKRAYLRNLPALYELPYEVLRATLVDENAKKRADADFHEARLARIDATGTVGFDQPDVLEIDLTSVSKDVSETDRERARCSLRPPLIGSLCPSTTLDRIKFDPPNGWQPMNPSICLHNGEMWCVVRTVNYTMEGRRYTVFDPKGVVRTENYLGRLTPNNELSDPQIMRDLDPSPRQKSGIVGYEDVRLVSVNGTLAASATVCDRDPERRMIARLDLDDSGDVIRAHVQETNQLHEKNWMPLSVDDEFTYIYSIDPTAVLPGPLWGCPLALDHQRGGAVTAFKDGYLCVTHEVVDRRDGRIYLHRFVRLDKRFRVTAVSRAWVFSHYGIEFCAGIVYAKNKLTLSYGVDDREAWIARFEVSEVEEMEWILP